MITHILKIRCIFHFLGLEISTYNYLFIHLRVFDPQLILLTLKEEKNLTCVLKVMEL